MKLQVKKLEQGVSGRQHASVHPHPSAEWNSGFGDAGRTRPYQRDR
jgi:hypothetical protein